MADELSSIVATGPQRLATGFGFTEGRSGIPMGIGSSSIFQRT